ncbi:class I SAM-dependent methyltransferase [Fangia hongkongensis]|uniref:class I SAM-dependent methyltransferase n=1 Tax=Fangia hongkongensis TaxID=270495 RepID=UPI00036F20E3|nr:class I SAM-dependent methyltransferase [Fangia hongkongensis]
MSERKNLGNAMTKNSLFYNNRTMTSLRKYVGKQLVSFLRKDNFAHAGESEAIDLVMSAYNNHRFEHLLDVGCGLGGTAQYIKDKGWSKTISGFDVDSEAIDYATSTYKDLNFTCCDVFNVSNNISTSFDMFCLFNVFYAFSDQKKALHELSLIARKGAQLAIFDYSDPCEGKHTPLKRDGKDGRTPFIPVKLDTIETMLSDTAWRPIEIVDISDQYTHWYSQLCTLLIENKSNVIDRFNEEAFDNALSTYSKLTDAIQKKLLGGTIVYAEKR